MLSFDFCIHALMCACDTEPDQKSTSFHFPYLMHNVAHKILISHTGQLQVYGNVCWDIRDGGHSLQEKGKNNPRTHIY